MCAHIKREGGRGSLVRQADWKTNLPRSFSRFVGNRFGEDGVVYRGGKWICTEGGETNASACRGCDADSVGDLKQGDGGGASCRGSAFEMEGQWGREREGWKILTMPLFACSMCRGRPRVVCRRGRTEGERRVSKTQGMCFVLASAGEELQSIIGPHSPCLQAQFAVGEDQRRVQRGTLFDWAPNSGVRVGRGEEGNRIEWVDSNGVCRAHVGRVGVPCMCIRGVGRME